MKTKIQWHPAFAAAMDLELIQNRNDLIYEKEYNLNTKPLEIDLLVIKKNGLGLCQGICKETIFRNFWKAETI